MMSLETKGLATEGAFVQMIKTPTDYRATGTASRMARRHGCHPGSGRRRY